MNYHKRIKKLQGRLKRKKLDALLVTQPENRRYLSGYSGGDHGIGETSGVLLIPARGRFFLLTDFRYELQAKQEAKDAEVLLYPKGLLALLKKMLPELGIKKLGFEGDYLLYSTFVNLSKLAEKVGVSLMPQQGLIEKMRLIKDENEIRLLRKSVRLNERIFQEVYDRLSPEMSEIDLAMAVENLMKQRASGPSFDTIAASGPNSALPHAVPTSSKLKRNQPLTLDMGLILKGYCSDMTRSFCFGRADKKYRKIHRIVREAQLAGMQKVRAGVRACEVDRAAREVIDKAGYGKYFGHSLGHGVGLAVHEEPRISSLNRQRLREGMVITIEPGIYLPGWGGVRLENMVVVRKDGGENLNRDTTELDI